MTFCPGCGRGVQADARFCGHCGATLAAAPPATLASAPVVAPAAETPRVRPTGVTILAVLTFISAVVWGLGGLAAMLGAGVVQVLGSATGVDFLDALGAVFSIVIFIFGLFAIAGAVLVFLLGRGLWTGKEWARVVALVLAGIGGGMSAIGLLASLRSGPVELLFQLVVAAVYGAVIWYLVQPGVRAFFSARGPVA